MSATPVVHIIDHMGLGGQQTQLRAVLPALRVHGFAPTLLNLRRPTALSQALEAAGVPVRSLGLPRWSPAQLPILVGELRRLRPSIVHTALTVGNLVGRAAALLAAVPTLIMEDQLSLSQEAYSVPAAVVLAARLAEPILAPRTSLFLGPSQLVQAASAAAKGWPAARCRVLPNAVDCRRFTPAANRAAARAELGLPDRLTVATFGRFAPQKRIGDVVELASRVRAAGVDVQFLIAGGGPLEGELRRSIAEAGLEQHVRLLGRRQDTERILAASDLYLSASGGEVLSVAVLEAMASGCAVVATRAGGTAEQVTPGLTGQLAPVGDVAGLTHAVLELLYRPDERARLGANARRAALASYDVPIIAARLASLYQEALAFARSSSLAINIG